MSALFEEIVDALKPVDADRPTNIRKPTTFEHPPQDVASVAIELNCLGINIPKQPALFDRYGHGPQPSMGSRAAARAGKASPT